MQSIPRRTGATVNPAAFSEARNSSHFSAPPVGTVQMKSRVCSGPATIRATREQCVRFRS
jgi:hypothetical protein